LGTGCCFSYALIQSGNKNCYTFSDAYFPKFGTNLEIVLSGCVVKMVLKLKFKVIVFIYNNKCQKIVCTHSSQCMFLRSVYVGVSQSLGVNYLALKVITTPLTWEVKAKYN
jgi:hypothetical protein